MLKWIMVIGFIGWLKWIDGWFGDLFCGDGGLFVVVIWYLYLFGGVWYKCCWFYGRCCWFGRVINESIVGWWD